MSGIRKLIQNLMNKPSKARIPLITPPPTKPRFYKDINSSIPSPGEVQQLDLGPLKSIQLEQAAENDEFVHLDEVTRQTVITLMLYHEYLYNFTSEHTNNPDFIHTVHEILEIVAQDKPIKKQLLYSTCPELFPYEIEQSMSAIPFKEKYKNLGLPKANKDQILLEEQKGVTVSNLNSAPVARISKPTTPVPADPRQSIGSIHIWDSEDPALNEIDEYFTAQEINRRHLYIWSEIKETYIKSADLLEKYAEKLGTVGAAINYIKLKESKTGEEQQVLDGLDYIQRLMLEHEEYRETVLYHVLTNKKLDFPMSDRLKKIWLDAATEVYQQNFIQDLPSFLGIPDNTERYLKELKMKEQRARDTMILEDKDRASAAKLLTEQGDHMLVRRDLSAKDEKLIKKMSYLSELIDVKHPPEIRVDTSRNLDPNFLRAQFKDQSAFGKSEGEFYEENLIKMLFLNNSRPEEFDLEYWAENLNIFPHQLKSIFNYVSFPVVINNQALGKLEFIESKKKKTVMDIIKENDRKEKEERSFHVKKEIKL